MSRVQSNSESPWLTQWLDRVADGSSKMSQRKLSTIERRVGLPAVKKAARKRGVHLLKLKDDRDQILIAASRNAFEVVC